MAVLAGVGILYGLLAHWRRSLRPSMIAHFLMNAIGLVAMVTAARRL